LDSERNGLEFKRLFNWGKQVMRWLTTLEMIQLISSATGITLTFVGAILRLNDIVTRENFINIAFTAIILFAVIPFFLEYIRRMNIDNEENNDKPNQQEEI
jgi:hypothetical protein